MGKAVLKKRIPRDQLSAYVVSTKIQLIGQLSWMMLD